MKEHYKGLGHIAIYTADMEQSIAFYENIGGSVFKRDGVQTPDGEKKLALVEFGGFLLELIEPPAGTLVPSGEGSIPHFAVYVDDLDKTAADLKAAGVISFTAPEKKVLPNTFGGLQNWFFTNTSRLYRWEVFLYRTAGQAECKDSVILHSAYLKPQKSSQPHGWELS